MISSDLCYCNIHIFECFFLRYAPTNDDARPSLRNAPTAHGLRLHRHVCFGYPTRTEPALDRLFFEVCAQRLLRPAPPPPFALVVSALTISRASHFISYHLPPPCLCPCPCPCPCSCPCPRSRPYRCSVPVVVPSLSLPHHAVAVVTDI